VWVSCQGPGNGLCTQLLPFKTLKKTSISAERYSCQGPGNGLSASGSGSAKHRSDPCRGSGSSSPLHPQAPAAGTRPRQRQRTLPVRPRRALQRCTARVLELASLRPHPHARQARRRGSALRAARARRRPLCPQCPSLTPFSCARCARRSCKAARCRCAGFFFVVAEGAWVLRCR
jgi:hypothetical protein